MKMTLTTMTLAGLALAMTAGTTLADDRGGWGRGGADNGDRGARMMQRFEDMDADKDGSVTLAEFSARMIERFDAADADKDGSITTAELEKALPGRRASEMAPMLLARFDIDSNQSVTKVELANRQAKMFALLDLDDSGAISKEELPKGGMMMGGGHRNGKGRN